MHFIKKLIDGLPAVILILTLLLDIFASCKYSPKAYSQTAKTEAPSDFESKL
jgi:hypothetical protein